MQKVNGWHLPDCDVHFRDILERKGNYIEEHLVKALDFVQNWDTAVDVGAHIGLCSKILATRFKTVHAFEPAPDTFACLQLNLQNYSNVMLYRVALGEGRALVRLEDDLSRPTRVGNTGARFVREGGDIPMFPLDSRKLDNVGFLKIDVEGYELHVLQGARDMLIRDNPTVEIEVGKSPKDRYDLDALAPVRFLEEMGMREVLRIKPDRIFVW